MKMEISRLIWVPLYAGTLLMASEAAANTMCDCAEVVGTCSASFQLAPQGDRPLDNVDLIFTANASQCAKVDFYIDGKPFTTLIPNGRSARDEISITDTRPMTRDRITELRCRVCKTSSAQTGPESAETQKREREAEALRVREEAARAEAQRRAEEEQATREQEEVERLIAEKVASGTLSRDYHKSRGASTSTQDVLALTAGTVAAGMATNPSGNRASQSQLDMNRRLIGALAQMNGATSSGISGATTATGTTSGSQCPIGPRCQSLSEQAETAIARLGATKGIADSAKLAYCGNMLGHSVATQCATELDGMGRPDCAALARQEAQAMLETAQQAAATENATSAGDWRRSCGLN